MNMSNKKYTNYLFDLYGTLVDIHTDEEKLELWEKMSLFYGYYGAAYTAAELHEAYLQEVENAQKEAMNKRRSSLKSNELVSDKKYILFNADGLKASKCIICINKMGYRSFMESSIKSQDKL